MTREACAVEEGSYYWLAYFFILLGVFLVKTSKCIEEVYAEIKFDLEWFEYPSASRLPLLKDVHASLADIARRAEVKTPSFTVSGRFKVGESNAYCNALGKNRSRICVSAALLSDFDKGEIEGVLAHEVAHITRFWKDQFLTILLTALAETTYPVMHGLSFVFLGFSFAGIVNGMNVVIMALLCAAAVPLSCLVLTAHAAFRRRSEHKADACIADLVGAPDGLVRYLRKTERNVARKPATKNNVEMGARGILMYIVPLISKVFNFRTHPPSEERIKRLERFAARKKC